MDFVETKGAFGQALCSNIEELSPNDVCIAYSHCSGFLILDHVNFDKIRFAAEDKIISSNEISVGSQVEVKFTPQPINDIKSFNKLSEPYYEHKLCLQFSAWWPAVVKKIEGDLYDVELVYSIPEGDEFSSCDALLSSIKTVKLDDIRKPCEVPYGIDLKNLHKSRVLIPVYLRKFAEAPALHKKLLSHIPCKALLSIEINEKGESWIVFYSSDPKIDDHVNLLIEDHWFSLNNKRTHLRKLNFPVYTANRRSELALPVITKDYENAAVVERFPKPCSFIKFCVGLQGKHVSMVRAMKGIIDVIITDAPAHAFFDKNDPMGWITIFAENEEAAIKAREAFNFTRVSFNFPEEFTGRLIGRQTANISAVIEKTHVIHINHLSHDLDRREVPVQTVDRTLYVNLNDKGVTCIPEPLENVTYTTFFIEGLVESVDKALLLLTTQIDNFREISELRDSVYVLSRNLSARLGPLSQKSPVKPQNNDEVTKEVDRRLKTNSDLTDQAHKVKNEPHDTRRFVDVSPKKKNNQGDGNKFAGPTPKKGGHSKDKTRASQSVSDSVDQDAQFEQNLHPRPIVRNPSSGHYKNKERGGYHNRGSNGYRGDY